MSAEDPNQNFRAAVALSRLVDPRQTLENLARKRGLPFFKISSVTGEGIDKLKRAMGDAVLEPVS